MSINLTQQDERVLYGVNPQLAKVMRRAAEITTIPFKLTEGLRSVEQQRKNVAKGVSWTMNSRHLTGEALDVVPMVDVDKDGKIEVSEMYSWPLYFQLAKIIKQAAKDVGVVVEWGGDWKKNKDGPHWQLPWKRNPPAIAALANLPPEVTEAPRVEELTDRQADTRAVITAGGGFTTGAGIGGEPIIDALSNGLQMQSYELSSGDTIRIVLAVGIIALTAYLAWRQTR